MAFKYGLSHFVLGMKIAHSLQAFMTVCMLAQATADTDDTQDYSLVPVSVCNRIAIPDYPDHYVQHEGLFFSIQRCHRNMYYDANLCECMPDLQAFKQLFQMRKYLPTSSPSKPPPTQAPNKPPPTQAPKKPPPTQAPKKPLPTQAPKKQTFPTTTSPTTTSTTTPLTTTTITTTSTASSLTVQVPTESPEPKRRQFIFSFFEIPHDKPVISDSRQLSVQRRITTPAPDRICDGCTFDRGVGYNTHKTDCDKYVLCYPKGIDGHLTGEVRHCGIGQYWDPEFLTCRPSKEVLCPHERCTVGSDVDTYAYDNDCRGYWKCQNGVSVGFCCPRGHAYKYGLGCVPDSSCNTPCDSVDTVKGCDKESVPGNPWVFRQRSHQGFVQMSCAAGTVFSERLCRCQYDKTRLKPNSKACKKEFDLAFQDGSITDTSGSGNYVDSFNISYASGLACFTGDGALLLPRFSNAEIGDHFSIHIKYSFTTSSDKMQALVFNGDCDQYSSVVVTANTQKISLGLRSRRGKFKTLTVATQPATDGWYDVRFAYHDGVMSISQYGQIQTLNLRGGVARSRCALKIGWGENYDSFTGCIEHLSLSFCPEP